SNVCFGMTQDDRGVLYFATKSGVLQFDGRHWDLMGEAGPVYTIVKNSSDEIYWGGSNGYGKIGYDKNGFQISELLSDRIRNVFQSVSVKDNLYFLNEGAIFCYSTSSHKTITIKSTAQTGSFLGLFELFGKLYVSTQYNGLFTLDQNKLIKSKIVVPGGSEVVFTSPLD